jgi:pimeloyl-ACP methyl ester carboxylesterase
LLQAKGHEAYTPSLTGIGERAHLASPQVDLSLHVQDVVNAVWYEDLRDITLVGYSYGGMVVTGALDYLGGRVKRLVYLDAFVPDDGQSLRSLTGGEPPLPESFPGGTWLIEPPAREFDDPADAEFASARRVGHPQACFVEAVRLRTPLEARGISLTYIKATGEPRPAGGGPFWSAGDRARGDCRWSYFEIATNHMIPFNRPEELVEVLLKVSVQVS